MKLFRKIKRFIFTSWHDYSPWDDCYALNEWGVIFFKGMPQYRELQTWFPINNYIRGLHDHSLCFSVQYNSLIARLYHWDYQNNTYVEYNMKYSRSMRKIKEMEYSVRSHFKLIRKGSFGSSKFEKPIVP